jgi:flagellar hook protein FlgE
MAFQQGLSGLYAASKALDVTSNNVANAATVGFKSAQAHFSDVYAASLGGGGGSQVGIGTSVSAVQQLFTQGNITTTNNPLDISINGGGFYRMSTNGTITYSRAGQFHLDKDGYVVDDRARKLTGYLSDAAGTIVQAAPAELVLSSANQDPIATGASGTANAGVKASLNLDSRSVVPTNAANFSISDPTSYNFSTATAIYDSLGNAHTMTIYASKTWTSGTTASAINAATAATNAANAAKTAGTLANTTPTAANIAASTSAAAVATAAATAATAAATAATNAQNVALNPSASYDTAASTTASTAAIASATAAALAATTAAAWATVPAGTTTDPTADITAAVTAATAATTAANPLSDWLAYTSVDGTAPSNISGSPTAVSFNTSGQLTGQPVGGIALQIDLNAVMAGLTTPQTNIAASPLSFNLDFTGTTQFGSSSGTNSLQQDGYTSGRLTGVNVGSDGVIRGNYSNGQARDLGQVVLTSFTNPNGLTSLGGNQWAETSASGSALVGAPNTGTLGVLQSAAVEESNTDLTAELVNMITEQRNYQANAQSIKTQDQILQTLVNLR